MNRDDPAVAGWSSEALGHVDTFGADDEPFELALLGAHNQLNAQAAWAVGRVLGVSRAAAARAIKAFAGLPSRLALVAERNDVRYYDDSKATTPAGAIAAVNSFPQGRVIAIVGGYDKHVPLEEMCDELAERCKCVVATGQVGPEIAGRLEQTCAGEAPAVVILADRFDDAVAGAIGAAEPGDVVLLSPGCASYDQFPNYVQRSKRFLELVAGADICAGKPPAGARCLK